MDSKEVAEPVGFYFTEHGELRFYDLPKPRFAFYNPKAKKNEIVCFSSTIRAIANSLSEAQEIARRHLPAKSLGPEASQDPEKTGEEQVGAQGGDDHVVYCKEVSSYGNEIKLKNNLQVNVYKGRPRIWLKPWWQNVDAGTPTIWFPSNAGFQFSLFDSGRDLVAFADKHMANSYRRASAESALAALAEPTTPNFSSHPEKSLLPEGGELANFVPQPSLQIVAEETDGSANSRGRKRQLKRRATETL